MTAVKEEATAVKEEATAVKEEEATPLSEENVGITEFLGSHPGFFGIIKQRYSDFLVNEIGASGEVLHLTDVTNLPNPPVVEVSDTATETPVEEEVGLPDGVTEEIHQQIKDLASSKSTSNAAGSVIIVVDSLSKEQRKAIHHFVQVECEGLVSTTDDVNGQKVIRVSVGSAASLHRERKRRVPRQPKLFTRFLLYKENMDTMEAVGKLASKLRLRAQDVGYAGTKDRRGKTVQLASISKIPPSRIADAARCVPRLRVGNFSFSPDGLSLGQLGGNAFTIVLREVKGSDEDIAAAVTSVQGSGILNYYGLQRFGTQPGHTHVVGRHLLQADWAKAIETILIPRPGDLEGKQRSETIQAWREKRLTGEEAMNKMQYMGCMRGGVERHLIQGMMQRGDTDKLGAINSIPRNWRTLYLHAYQAWLWNRLVSRRVKQHGTAVLPGDLVMVGAAGDKDVETEAEEEVSVEEDMDSTDCPEEEKEVSSAAPATDDGPGKGCVRKGSAKLEKLHSCVRAITAEEVHTIQLQQVVIPSVGYAVRLPDNHLADWYRDMLKEDNLTMDNLDPKHKSFAVSGAYRPLLLKPKDLTYKIAYYTDPFKSLAISDLDKINGVDESTFELDTDPSSQNSPSTNVTTSNQIDGDNANGSSSIKLEVKEQSETDNLEPVSNVKEEMMQEGSSSEEKVSETANNENGSACSEDVENGSACSEDVNGTEASVAAEEVSEASSAAAGGVLKTQQQSLAAPSAPPPRLKAVVLQFSLPPAGYATMVLRELLKIDTGSQFHASLNSSHSSGERGRGGYRGASRGGGGDRGRGNWPSHRGGNRGFRGGDRSHRGGRGRGFHGSRGDHKRSFSGHRSDRGGNKRPRF